MILILIQSHHYTYNKLQLGTSYCIPMVRLVFPLTFFYTVYESGLNKSFLYDER